MKSPAQSLCQLATREQINDQVNKIFYKSFNKSVDKIRGFVYPEFVMVQTEREKTPHEFLDSSSLLADGPALRERADTEGYLFFKGLLPREDVLAVRRDVLDIVDSYGWRKKGQDSLGGEIDVNAINTVPNERMRVDVGVSEAAYGDIQKLESVHRLPHHSKLLELYATLFNAGVLVHPRHIVRMITPHQCMSPTPEHQDFPIIQGTTQTWTCWFPLGDCPRELGSLSVLRESHKLGCLPIQPAKGAGGIAAQLCAGEEKNWVSGDFSCGDVLTFPAFTVHRALPCQTKDQIRASMDIRFQPVHEVIESRSLAPHCPLTWEEIYAGWKRDDLKYYWHHLPLKFSLRDDSLRQPGRRIC